MVGLQEVSASEGMGNQGEFLAAALDAHVAFDPVTQRPGEPAIGNAVVSRYAIRRRESIVGIPEAGEEGG